MRRTSTRRPRSRGQALVEFALVFPLFILLLAGMIDFGMGLNTYMTLLNATRDGARLGATACSATTTCASAVSARVTAAANGLGPSVSVVCKTAGGATESCATPAVKGDSVTVSTSVGYRMVWPLAFGSQLTISSSVTYMVE